MTETLELYGPWFKSTCKKCRQNYFDEEDSDAFETGLCYECFEESLEDLEEKRRERIARENEY